MARTRPTVADLRAMKGKRQLTMLRVLTLEEAEAAERAGVDIVSIPPTLMLDPRYRDAAPSLFSMPGDNFYEIGTSEDFIRWAFQLYKASADAVYCSASYATVKAMAGSSAYQTFDRFASQSTMAPDSQVPRPSAIASISA